MTGERPPERRAAKRDGPPAGTGGGAPHQGVYVRLRPSPVHGVGVFAFREIPRGCRVFGDDDAVLVRVPARTVHSLRGDLRDLYRDFCILEADEYLCPRSFNELTLSWYVNHSEDPNLECDRERRFVATRRIRRGEELTADYRTYSDDPLPGLGAPADT